MGESAGEEAIVAPLAPRWRLRARAPAAERDLIHAAQRGSADALEELARRSWPHAYRSALVILRDRAAAEDVAQDSVLAALDSLDRFNARRPFGPWLHRIAANRALDWVRKRARHAEIDATLDPPAAGALADDGLSDEMLSALRGLSPQERAAFVLRHLAGMSSREIATTLGSTPGAVRSMLHRARGHLAAELEPPNEQEAR